MPRLFSYVVDHDYGSAPNPFGGLCTLVTCKYSKKRNKKYKNILELAEEGDWVVGTGGANLKKSAGHGRIIYAMRVGEKLPITEYRQDKRFRGRDKSDALNKAGKFALVSRHFFYFGRNAINIQNIPQERLEHVFEKKGPGFRSDFSDEFIEGFAQWLNQNYKVGVHGDPCGHEDKSRNCVDV